MTSAQKIIDHELAQFGWVDSVAINSISEFKSPKANTEELTTNKEKSDLIDRFICHLIFYVIFCYSIFLYVAIDLGVYSFLEKIITTFMKFNHKRKISSFELTL